MVSFSKFVVGQRGSQQLVDTDGYVYTRKKERDTALTTAWRCLKFRKCKCPCHVYLTTDETSLQTGSKPHTHQPDTTDGDKKVLIQSLKRKAEEQHLSVTQNLLTEVLTVATPAVNIALPKWESLARIVQRSRAKASGAAAYTEPPTAREFVLPESCKKTGRDECFVIFDGMSEDGVRMIVFGTESNLRILASHPNWICDGTFYVAPRLFYQSYSVHAVIDGKCVPLVYALLSDKTEKSYVFFLTILRDAFSVQISHGLVMIDFELAAINAFQKVFEQFVLQLCFFHLCQSVQKRIHKKFKAIYNTDKGFARASRLIVFLAFVPVDSVPDAFEEIGMYIANFYPTLLDILNYFEANYLGLTNVDGSKSNPKFNLKFWNVYDLICMDPEYPRTSNMVEGFHRGFRTRVNRPKPSVQEYFRAIREEQVKTDYHMDRLSAGITPSKKRKTCNNWLYEIVCSYGKHSTLLEYLFDVAEFFGHMNDD